MLSAKEMPGSPGSKVGHVTALEQTRIKRFVKSKRSELRNGLTRRQRTFILEKLVGLNDKDAALVAGYSLSVAENTKQRIWKPPVRAEWERLQREVAARVQLVIPSPGLLIGCAEPSHVLTR